MLSQDQLLKDEAAIARYIKALRHVNMEVRSSAADALRQIIPKYPSGSSDLRNKDSGEARWMEKVRQIKPGMTKAEVQKILPPFPEAREQSVWADGGVSGLSYRLDCHWMVTVHYRNPDSILEAPKLLQKEWSAYVPAPAKYTGQWINWYVNGQKVFETDFKDGKYHGVVRHYYDNGQKVYEQHYTNGLCEGKDSGWHKDGKVSYVGQYHKGKQDGQWVHWYQSGQKSSESNFKDGKREGLYGGWYTNGMMRFMQHYHNGVQVGLEAAWDEQGKLQYQREVAPPKLIIREDTL